MKIFQTNAALGYRQLAFLIRLEKSANGYNYLCIGTHNVYSDNEMYQTGKIVEDLEDFYLEDTTFKITDSELKGIYFAELPKDVMYLRWTEWVNGKKRKYKCTLNK